MLPIGRGVPPFVGHDTSRGVLPLVYVNRPASANDQTHPEESNSDDGWRGGRRAISIVTRLRRAHSPRPFTLPIIIEKERRNGGEIGFLHALCIPSAGGAVFYRACKQGTDRKVTYIQSLLLLIFLPSPPFRSVPGKSIRAPRLSVGETIWLDGEREGSFSSYSFIPTLCTREVSYFWIKLLG